MQKEKLYRFIENPGLLGGETLNELKEVLQQFPYFQTGWILYLKNLKMVNSSEYEKILKNVAVRVPNRRKLYQWLNTEIHSTVYSIIENSNSGIYSSVHMEEGDEPINSNSLIDKFLSSNPGIRARKSSEEIDALRNQQDEVLEKSISEDNEMVTETLAMIYFQQKNYDKALDAFRKLSLKYPEKSTYFASRIEEIEKLKNI